MLWFSFLSVSSHDLPFNSGCRRTTSLRVCNFQTFNDSIEKPAPQRNSFAGVKNVCKWFPLMQNSPKLIDWVNTQCRLISCSGGLSSTLALKIIFSKKNRTFVSSMNCPYLHIIFGVTWKCDHRQVRARQMPTKRWWKKAATTTTIIQIILTKNENIFIYA